MPEMPGGATYQLFEHCIDIVFSIPLLYRIVKNIK
jgi:hypothetical protein